VKQVAKELTAELNRKPSNNEIAHRLTINLDELQYLLGLLQPITSLDLNADDRDLLPSIDLSDLDRIEQESVAASVAAIILDSLTIRETKIVQLRYGFEEDGKNLAQIARTLELSRGYVGSLHLKAVSKLRKSQLGKQLKDLLF
jgi:DNA-directed RNA polymerase specialized sigma subunit